jgi:hypothetical protein
MRTFKLMLGLLILSSCHQASKEKLDIPGKPSYFVQICDSTTQDCAEFLGSMDINSTRYKVINFFRRVKAAEMWHGQSRLIFLSDNDTLTYRLNSNSDFPSSIDSNKLYFPQKHELRKIDSLGNIICLSTGCVEKEENLTDILFLSPDSLANVFRGGYLPYE